MFNSASRLSQYTTRANFFACLVHAPNISVLKYRTGQDTDSAKLMKFVNMSLEETKVGKTPKPEKIEEMSTTDHVSFNDSNSRDKESVPCQKKISSRWFSAQENIDDGEVGLAFTMLRKTPPGVELGIQSSPCAEGEVDSVTQETKRTVTFLDDKVYSEENQTQMSNENFSSSVFQREHKSNEIDGKDEPSAKLLWKGLIETIEESNSL